MKNKLFFVFFILLFARVYGQSPDTLVVYDHIVVYDTIKIYDTLVVYDTVNIPDENFFQKNNSAQNAMLTIDTATKELSLKIIFQKDTATIPINSILLSENTKNSEAMKKEILTLVASAMMSQATFAQTGKMDTLSYPKTYSVGAGLTFDGGAGMMLKADYLKTKKLSFGIRSHVILRKNYSYTMGAFTSMDSVNYAEAITTSSHGPTVNVFLTSTYYFRKKGFCSKTGLYFTGGLGYERFISSFQTRTSNQSYDFDSKYTTQYLSLLACLGADYKIGPGKLSVDLPVTFGFYQKYNSKHTSVSSSFQSFDYSSDAFGAVSLNWLALNLGYTMYF